VRPAVLLGWLGRRCRAVARTWNCVCYGLRVSYGWFKALHIISFVAWFAGLFYIFRLYVYHVENKDKPEVTAVLEVMERKLYRMICTPAAISTLVFGLGLLHLVPTALEQGWFHVKLVALVSLFGYHGYAGRVRRNFAAGRYTLTSRQCRLINEVPTLALVVIVTMVVLKPVLW
jgi:putative membrane protein